MYFNVILHTGLDEFQESPNLTTIASAVAFCKAHKDYPVLGYHFLFFEDDGYPLRCCWLDDFDLSQPQNISNYCRFRSYASFRRVLSQCVKIAKYYELLF